MYFAVAEALSNVAKHAGARQAVVRVYHATGCCAPRSPTTAAGAPIRRTAPGWRGSSGASARLTASWQ